MTWLEAYCLAGLAILALMLALWAASLLLRDASIVDIFWGAGFVICAWLYFALTPQGYAGRKWLVCLLVTVWGLRLALHILRRNWGKGEDYRYRAWRQAAGRRWWWLSLFKVFLLQGALLWVISIPLLSGADQPNTGATDLAGRGGAARLGRWLHLRSCWRLAASALQSRPGEPGQSAATGRVALHAPPQLLRGCLRLVGNLPAGSRGGRLVDGL